MCIRDSAETSRAMRGPLPTLGANVHSLVSSPARSLLTCSHFCHSLVRGVDSRVMRSSLVTASAAAARRVPSSPFASQRRLYSSQVLIHMGGTDQGEIFSDAHKDI